MENRPHAIILSVDGVLVESFTTNIMLGIAAKITNYRVRNIPIAVACNQAGPAWHIVDANRFPSAATVATQLKAIARELVIDNIPWFVSLGDLRIAEKIGLEEYDQAIRDIKESFIKEFGTMTCFAETNPDWRKPAPGMLLAAAAHLQRDPANCLYIGSRPEDGTAALAAGMQYETYRFIYSDSGRDHTATL